MFIIDNNILKEVYPERRQDVKKYDFGLLLVIGGGQFYTGSPALSSMAAYRTGIDMVHIVAPKRAADIIAGFSPNFASFPLEGKELNKNHSSVLVSMTEAAKTVSNNKTAVVIGGGLGRSDETKEVIRQYLKQIDVPVVIDADAIRAVAESPEILDQKPFLITPHSYEFFVLTNEKVSGKNLEGKMIAVRNVAERLKTTILLKGPVDIISSYSDDDEIALNRTGSPYMTVGGTGDTLAGIAGALMAKGVNIFKAACAASYINGLAGELSAKNLGPSMTALDLTREIPNVIKK